MLSPLDLKRVDLETLEIRMPNEDALTGSPTEDYRIKVETSLEQKQDALDFRIGLRFRMAAIKNKVCRFQRVDIRLTGYFSLPPDTEEKLVNTLVPLNCQAILFGIARGIVGQATGMAPGGPLFLPPVNFVELMQKQEKRKTKKL